MALQIEGRFTKEEIFELYANQIYLGNRGTFAIHGLARPRGVISARMFAT